MVISSEFRMGQYTDDDHREVAPHFGFGYLEYFDTLKGIWGYHVRVYHLVIG